MTENAPITDQTTEQPAEPVIPEGWQGEKHWDQRKYHYIRGSESLCGGLMFYHGDITPGGLTRSSSPDDCAPCKRKVAAELDKAERA